jgi:hypothetical protein
MANGFSLGMLQMMSEVTKGATPAYKLDPYGFLSSLYTAHTPGAIKNDSYDGHFKTVKVKKKQRLTVADTSTTASCSIGAPIAYTEDTVSVANYRQVAFHIDDEVIAAFDSYASQQALVTGMNPNPITGLMFEFMDDLRVAANAVLQGVNQDLITLAVASVGVNIVTGAATSTALNITSDATKNYLAQGVTKLMADYKQNRMAGRPVIVGAGLMYNWFLQAAASSGSAFTGLDTRIQAAGMDFFLDYNIDAAISGTTNDILVYEPNAVQIVEYLKYQGFKAGAKPGGSQFGTLTLPIMNSDGTLVPVKFDYQLRYNDCDVVEGGTTYHKGYNMIISKNFGLYTIPTDAYKSGDVLAGNRGSLAYNVTNNAS